MGSSGRPADDAAQSAAQAACAGRLANSAASGLSRKVSSSSSQAGSSSEAQAMSSPPPSRQPRSRQHPDPREQRIHVVMRVPDRALGAVAAGSTRSPAPGRQARIDGEAAEVREAPGRPRRVDQPGRLPDPEREADAGNGRAAEADRRGRVGRIQHARDAADGDRPDRDREQALPADVRDRVDEPPGAGLRRGRGRPQHGAQKQRRQREQTADHSAAAGSEARRLRHPASLPPRGDRQGCSPCPAGPRRRSR